MSAVPVDISELNDALAREHSIDAYYAHSALPIRLIEQRRLAIIEAMLGPSDGLDVLEIGSGGGHVLARFPKARRVALDVSTAYLATAAKNLAGHENVRFVHGEADTAGFDPASFDRVICTEVLEHTIDPDRVLAAIARLLRPDGKACITVPNDPLILSIKAAARRTPAGFLLGDRVDWGGDRYHLHRWHPEEFRALLERRFHVAELRAAPFDALPIRVCALCTTR